MTRAWARRWAGRLWPVVALMLVWALFFWRFAAPDERDRLAYEAGDFTETFLGFHQQTYAAFVAGRWADWADCLWSGYPLGGDPQAQLFYPPKWATFLLLRIQGYGHYPLGALTAEVATHYLLVSLGMYGWLRGLRLRPGAAVLGAVTFAYGGYAMGYAPLQSAVLMTATWLPYVLWALDRLARRGSPGDLALAALAAALAFYAGHPQTFLFVGLLSGLYWGLRLWQLRRTRAWSVAMTAALGAFIFALCLAQLAPAVAFSQASTRARIAYVDASGGFPFADVLQLVITGVVSHWHPLFVGLLPLSLAVYGLRRADATRRFWLAVALVGLVLSFGERAGWTGAAFNLVPGWSLFRGQERLAIWVSFALATLAAHGADDTFGPLTRNTHRALRASTWTTVALWLGVGLLALGGVLVARLDLDRTDWRALPDRVGVLWLGASVALAFWLLRAYWMRATRALLPLLALTAVVTELYAANRPLNVVAAFDPTPPSVLLEPILEARDAAPTAFFRVTDDAGLPGHAGCLYGFRHVDGRTPIKLAAYAQFHERLPEPVQWQLLGVSYLITSRERIDDAGAQVIATAADGKIRTWRLSTEPRRAWLSHVVVSATSTPAVLDQLSQAQDLFDTAWLIGSSPDVSPATGTESIAVLTDTPGRITLRVNATAPAILTVTEAYAPGWQARLNGRSVEVRVSDGALLGLAVPAGETDVELSYAPVERSPSLWLSALAVVIALGLAGRDALKTRRARRA